jgi:hypothetical protein
MNQKSKRLHENQDQLGLTANRSVHGRVRATEERLLEQVGFELGKEDCCGERENQRSRKRRNYQK